MSRKIATLLGLLAVSLLVTGVSSILSQPPADQPPAAGYRSGMRKPSRQQDAETLMKKDDRVLGGVSQATDKTAFGADPGDRQRTRVAGHSAGIATTTPQRPDLLRVSHRRANSPSDRTTAEPYIPSAVRLADDVRLPAAVMPLAVPSGRSPVVSQANSEITNNFYRELQAAAAKQYGDSAGHGMDEVGAGEDTAVIVNGPETEEIRESADECFRAFYGDEKYIQQTLSSAVEVRLAPEPVQTQ